MRAVTGRGPARSPGVPRPTHRRSLRPSAALTVPALGAALSLLVAGGLGTVVVRGGALATTAAVSAGSEPVTTTAGPAGTAAVGRPAVRPEPPLPAGGRGDGR